MSGWDRDESGDYTPKPLPPWVLCVALAIGAAIWVLVRSGA